MRSALLYRFIPAAVALLAAHTSVDNVVAQTATPAAASAPPVQERILVGMPPQTIYEGQPRRQVFLVQVLSGKPEVVSCDYTERMLSSLGIEIDHKPANFILDKPTQTFRGTAEGIINTTREQFLFQRAYGFCLRAVASENPPYQAPPPRLWQPLLDAPPVVASSAPPPALAAAPPLVPTALVAPRVPSSTRGIAQPPQSTVK